MDTHNLKIFPTPESVVRCVVAIVDLPPCTPPGSASHSTWYYQDKETKPDNQVIESIKQPEWSRNQQLKHCTVSTYTTCSLHTHTRLYPLLTSIDRINTDISQLLQRYENIMATATVYILPIA